MPVIGNALSFVLGVFAVLAVSSAWHQNGNTLFVFVFFFLLAAVFRAWVGYEELR